VYEEDPYGDGDQSYLDGDLDISTSPEEGYGKIDFSASLEEVYGKQFDFC
jgi:hypothetical protein